jgi:hypothetical protein
VPGRRRGLRPLILPPLETLRALPVLAQGQIDDLKVEIQFNEDRYRTWLSRGTKEDGLEWDDEVTVERLVGGCWVSVVRGPGAEICPQS